MSFREPWMAAMLRDRRLCLMLLFASGLIAAAQVAGISLWRCPFHWSTGLPCPGCGMTRGIVSLIGGRWHEAWAHHPFAIVFLAGWLVFFGVTILPPRQRSAVIERIAAMEKATGITMLVLVLFAVYGLTRTVLTCFDAGTGGKNKTSPASTINQTPTLKP